MADLKEDIETAAIERRNLQGNNLFENLGEPIQQILLQVESQGKEIDDETMKLLQHITVKQLAKIFDMLGQGEDPVTILAWLKRRARKNKGRDELDDERRKRIITGADRDPIAAYKALAEANAAKAAEFEAMEEERAQLRAAKTEARKKQREEAKKAAEEAKKAMEDEGVWWKAVDVMPEKDKNAVNNAFEKFANKASDFDNTDMDQDGEWWKRDPFRRDWERNKGKGKKWTAVCEGAKDRATDPELAVREEFYRGNDWWKADKYKRDWDATKDAEWWKEEPYIKDWQQNKHEGARWRAADEESGLEGEGDKYPCSPEEAKRREEWYKANGPRGVVKKWNAATEGDPEKCSVPEKHAREEFYRNGDWWKNDDARQDFKDRGLDSDPLQYAAKPTDTEWWKQAPFRDDFFKNGDKGKKWPAITEEAAVGSAGDKKPAPDLEKKRREKWYKDNWWKQPEFKDDWKKNKRAGKKWRAPTLKEAQDGYTKPIGEEETRKREEWYRNADDDWWKAPTYIEDYFQKKQDGRHWPAKTEQDGLCGKGKEKPASADEKKKREDWYLSNWWKQPKYIDDFHKNGRLGAAWTAKNDDPQVDKEWWKQGPFIENWANTMRMKSLPEGQEWWKQPEYVEDFHKNGPSGRKWTADTETHGVEGSGNKNPCPADDKQYREAWYKDNWWRAPQHAHNWAKFGPKGQTWRAANKAAADDPKVGAKEAPCTDKEQRGREAFYRPLGDMWRACGEEQGFAKKANENPCAPAEALKRDEWYRQNWWKAPEYVEDWKKNGASGKKWPAGNEASGKAGRGAEDPCSQEEQQRRDNWYRNACDIEWWKEPQYCEDWGQNGPDGAMWTADTRQNANRCGGKEHPCPSEEKQQRDEWYRDNWWKTPACIDDWMKHGKTGPECGRKKPSTMDRQDPETVGDGWWKKPEYVQDWLDNGDDGKHWTGVDPVAAASGQGHKKPASDPEKAKREKWYRDNWWKAPSCADDWSKAGHNGKKWTGATPEATKEEAGDKKPCDPKEKDKREDWYRKHGDGDDWWKKPEFIGDYQDAGPSGKKWTAGNPTAGALGLGHECPASGPQKKKREDWYKDNWWKAPRYCDDWAKGPASKGDWKRDATPDEEKKRDAWYRQNRGEPASPNEQDARDAWYRKHPKEPSGAQLDKRENWYRTQLSDDDKAKRMDWLRDRDAKEKRILADELADALAAINEGQPPTEKQVQDVMDAINWARSGQKDDFANPDDEFGSKRGTVDDEPEMEGASGRKRGVADEEEPTITKGEFLDAVARSGFFVPHDKDEEEMQEEEERAEQEKEEMQREEEERAYLAMDAEEEQKKKPLNWQRKYVDPNDNDWWKRPAYIEEYQNDPEDTDASWRRDAEGSKDPATDDEQERREQWYKDNWWKAPKFSTEWRRDGEAGENWKKVAQPDDDEEDDDDAPEVAPEEVAEREKWYRNAQAPERQTQDGDTWWKRPEYIEDFEEGGKACMRDADADEEKEREQWFKDNWWKAPKHIENFKKSAKEPEAAPATWARKAPEVSESEPVAEAAPEVVQERTEWFKKALEPFEGEKLDEPFEGEKLDDQEPFEGEKLGDEEPFAGEKLGDQEPFQGEKLGDQEPFAGEKLGDQEPFEGEKLGDQEPFEGEKLGNQEPFAGEKFVNEDDAPEDPSWEDQMQDEDDRNEDEDEEMEDPEEDAQEAPDADEEAAWNEEIEDDDEDDDAEAEPSEDDEEEGDNDHQEDEDLEAELEAALEEQEQEWEEDEDEEEEAMQEQPSDEEGSNYSEEDEEAEKPPEPWVMPLPEVTNNIYLKSYFPVLKWNPSKSFGPADRRVWVVDHFSKSFYCLDGKGKLKKQHDANKLLQLERNVMDPRRARLMFFDAPKSYEIVFPNTEERERFYETGSSIRPAIRVYAPSLTKPDTAVDGGSTTTTIDGVKENAVVQKVENPFKKTGELVDRELSGRCKINSSKVQDEPVTVWTGTFNMCGAPPPKDLSSWMPRGKFDIYAVGAQECSWQKSEGEWFDRVQEYLGKEYLTLASMQLWDITIIVLCRKKCLLKITNVEGSTKATLHKEKCGMKGAAGICLRFHNTSMAFVSCHLAARLERTKMRKVNIEEIVNQIQLANRDADLTSQFHHVFWMGDMNYRIEMENAEAEPLVQGKKYNELLIQDQLTKEMLENGILHGFKEAPITFAPTYRYQPGSGDYMRDRGRAPSYTDRILVKSMRNTTMKCTGYGVGEGVTTSEHRPVFATYVVRCLRPHMACFHRDQEPRPQFEISSIRFTEQNHLMFRKPQLLVYTPFSEYAHKGAVMKVQTMMPEFTGAGLPGAIKSTVQMTEYLERHAMIFIFRDNAEPREDKMFRGAAVMELDGRVEPYDEEREADLEVLCVGRKVGMVNVKYKVTNAGYTPPPGGAAGRVPQEVLMDGEGGAVEAAEDDDEE